MPKCSIVIDLGFGDAGKGLTTDFLASQHPKKSLVIRFSGGHQVGHTVTTPAITHTFSNFGSGTLQNVPTFYTEKTTIFPPAIFQEGKFLKAYQPQLYLHPLAMVTTLYDIAFNRAVEKQQQHGSCGLGFGTTIARNKEEIFFFANDLQFEWVIKQRLNSIKTYYEHQLKAQPKEVKKYYKEELKQYDETFFIESCKHIQAFYSIANLPELVPAFEHFIFEGSQGILLDTQYGFYPHTTWSNTTSKNALQLIEKYLKTAKIEIYYVTRCYQTRHGNGPMSATKNVQLQHNENEANVENEFQGKFRTKALDVSLLNYALSCDAIHHPPLPIAKKLMVTCLDQLPDFSMEGFVEKLEVHFQEIYGSYGPGRTTIKPIHQKTE
ncbi:adenylosuccinate synthetase [Zunongwangia pacifica]|uniref:Adenylosuccinate synthetase n=1 Tax=Zunongwangia pacifica TaxID=2911062 RepID=A0A9X1ZS44_9FLAO|nr:adenylosuccinate synthetase [Zunongwangia pacifica]MCL6218904.1 adenylosuccinate synthetase [Zunongwangia pacifica]